MRLKSDIAVSPNGPAFVGRVLGTFASETGRSVKSLGWVKDFLDGLLSCSDS
jgi:hypothetical protein